MLQEPFLFSRTIRENLAITSPDLAEADLHSAARTACLEETVAGFTKGYDTFVGERGVTLSGGQKQRAAIARMLTRTTPIMIFDDSLSAVDTETDAKIRSALEKRFGSATIILISHRITTLSKADKVLVLDHGRIAQFGTPAELSAQPGLYKQIEEIQSYHADNDDRTADSSESVIRETNPMLQESIVPSESEGRMVNDDRTADSSESANDDYKPALAESGVNV